MPTDVTAPVTSVTTDGTVQTLFTTSTAGVYVLHLSRANQQAGDDVEIACTARVVSGGALRNVFAPVTLEDAASEPDIHVRTVPVILPRGGTFTIERTAGGDRSYAYRVERIVGLTVVATNTLNVTGGPHSLGGAQTDNATYVVISDHGNMQAGDQVAVRAKSAVVSGGSAVVDDVLSLEDAQDDALGTMWQQSVPFPSVYSLEAEIELLAGVAHNVDYAVCKVG